MRVFIVLKCMYLSISCGWGEQKPIYLSPDPEPNNTFPSQTSICCLSQSPPLLPPAPPSFFPFYNVLFPLHLCSFEFSPSTCWFINKLNTMGLICANYKVPPNYKFSIWLQNLGLSKSNICPFTITHLPQYWWNMLLR